MLRVSQSVREFETNATTRGVLNSLRDASEEIVMLTATAKERVASCDPVLTRAQARYEYTLARVDTKLEKLEVGIAERMYKLRNQVEGPAARIAAFAAGMRGVATRFAAADDD
jgi:hypothetical protein